MDSITYQMKRDHFIRNQRPYRIVEPGDLLAAGENVYKIGGYEVQVTPGVASEIDEFIGVRRDQATAVQDTFGSDGVRNLRNYLAMSNSVQKAGKLALSADPQRLMVTGATRLKKEAIPADSFFDFLDFFMDKNDYEPEQFYLPDEGHGGIFVKLKPLAPQYHEITSGEDFMTNGLWFRWNLGEVQAGNYFMRMVCSNGAMVESERKIAKVNSLDENIIRSLLALPKNQGFMEHNYNQLTSNARMAMNTAASLAEVRKVAKLLRRYGVDDQTIDDMAPFQQLSDYYSSAGYDMKVYPANQAMSDMTMWELFNRITWFASHSPEWSEEDNRRSGLMIDSVKLLSQPRDIKKYINVF